MYRIHLDNFGYFSSFEFATLADSLAYMKSVGFETSLYEGENRIASYSPITGLRCYDERGNRV